MAIFEKLLLALNKCFKLPVHPFNLKNDGVKSYAEWQFEKGANTIKFYTEFTSPEDMFSGKRVLDVGCGAAGKSLYYVSLGASSVTGLEILPKYRAEAEALAKIKGFDERFEFVCGDAADTGLRASSFDTIIMNDAMEHVAEPAAVLGECARLLSPGGRVFINFPPYNHPFGAHLSDAISIPWVHVFFSQRTLISAYKHLVSDLPDGEERIGFRISRHRNGGEHLNSGDNSSGAEYFSYINRMTIRRFNRILRDSKEFTPIYYKEIPLRGFLKPLAMLPGFREFFVKMVVTVLGRV